MTAASTRLVERVNEIVNASVLVSALTLEVEGIPQSQAERIAERVRIAVLDYWATVVVMLGSVQLEVFEDVMCSVDLCGHAHDPIVAQTAGLLL